MKTPISFSCYSAYSHTDQTDWTVFMFYPNGVWDEWKWTLEEAIALYPPSKYEWILLKDN